MEQQIGGLRYQILKVLSDNGHEVSDNFLISELTKGIEETSENEYILFEKTKKIFNELLLLSNPDNDCIKRFSLEENQELGFRYNSSPHDKQRRKNFGGNYAADFDPYRQENTIPIPIKLTHNGSIQYAKLKNIYEPILPVTTHYHAPVQTVTGDGNIVAAQSSLDNLRAKPEIKNINTTPPAKAKKTSWLEYCAWIAGILLLIYEIMAHFKIKPFDK